MGPDYIDNLFDLQAQGQVSVQSQIQKRERGIFWNFVAAKKEGVDIKIMKILFEFTTYLVHSFKINNKRKLFETGLLNKSFNLSTKLIY